MKLFELQLKMVFYFTCFLISMFPSPDLSLLSASLDSFKSNSWIGSQTETRRNRTLCRRKHSCSPISSLWRLEAIGERNMGIFSSSAFGSWCCEHCNIVYAQNLGSTPSETKREAAGHGFYVHGKMVQFETLELWTQCIYAEDKESNGDHRPRIVGPVGEHPLHVWFLRANEFKSKSAEDQSIRQGILNGAKKYTENDTRETTVPYGKDYCAAVGSRILAGHIDVHCKPLPPYSTLCIGSIKHTAEIEESRLKSIAKRLWAPDCMRAKQQFTTQLQARTWRRRNGFWRKMWSK